MINKEAIMAAKKKRRLHLRSVKLHLRRRRLLREQHRRKKLLREKLHLRRRLRLRRRRLHLRSVKLRLRRRRLHLRSVKLHLRRKKPLKEKGNLLVFYSLEVNLKAGYNYPLFYV
jgi:hypothetical protein